MNKCDVFRICFDRVDVSSRLFKHEHAAVLYSSEQDDTAQHNI